MSYKEATKIAVVGSHYFKNVRAVRKLIRSFETGTWVISGGAIGVDQVAITTSGSSGLSSKTCLGPEYAGRNDQMIVDECDRLEAFWDGSSTGTKRIIDVAKRAGKLVTIHCELKR